VIGDPRSVAAGIDGPGRGVNDASYNCKGTPTWRPSQIIRVAVALPATPKLREGGWATKPRLWTGALRTRLLGSFGVASSYSAPRCRAKPGYYFFKFIKK
jgi:hypothetical protein